MMRGHAQRPIGDVAPVWVKPWVGTRGGLRLGVHGWPGGSGDSGRRYVVVGDSAGAVNGNGRMQ